MASSGHSLAMESLLNKIIAQKEEESVEQPKQGALPNGKKTRGRVKVNMVYVENKTRRMTTFSKRKHGLFKKVNELEILTGAQCMMIVASETGQVYSYASPKFQPFLATVGKEIVQSCLMTPDPLTGQLPSVLRYNFAPINSPQNRFRCPVDPVNQALPAPPSAPTAASLQEMLGQDTPSETGDETDDSCDVSDDDGGDGDPSEVAESDEPPCKRKKKPETPEQMGIPAIFSLFPPAFSAVFTQQRGLVNINGTWFPPSG